MSSGSLVNPSCKMRNITEGNGKTYYGTISSNKTEKAMKSGIVLPVCTGTIDLLSLIDSFFFI